MGLGRSPWTIATLILWAFFPFPSRKQPEEHLVILFLNSPNMTETPECYELCFCLSALASMPSVCTSGLFSFDALGSARVFPHPADSMLINICYCQGLPLRENLANDPVRRESTDHREKSKACIC